MPSSMMLITTTPPSLPFKTVLIANRGEIAIRFIHAVHSLNLRAAAIFASDDSTSPHVRLADVAHNLGPSHTLYNDIPTVLSAAKLLKAEAVLPGYGFLSENPDAATAFTDAGIVWLGPTAETITLFGLKHTARAAATASKVPIVPGSDPVTSLEETRQVALRLGFPVLIKAAAGGGGMGQAVVKIQSEIERAYHSVVTQAETMFGSSVVFVERFVEHARHVEVQVFGDGKGRVVALGDRDCSVQRRRQKVIEEAPAPDLPPNVRAGLHNAAVSLCASHNYRSAGTVEFIVDSKNPEQWFFLEVNTRLQVEHGVTELVSGVDIVQTMILLGAGVNILDKHAPSLFNEKIACNGVAIQGRVYAENPVKDYAPCPGTISDLSWPLEEDIRKAVGGDGSVKLRVDPWAERGVIVASHYDPLLGKVMIWAPTRSLALLALHSALSRTRVRGVDTNIELLQQVLLHPKFSSAQHTTNLLSPSTFKPRTKSMQVITPGLQSSLQDYPGRIGYWSIGVSPSGPMDAYAMGMANALVGNSQSHCALEMTVTGPTLYFHTSCIIALTGAEMYTIIEDTQQPIPYWTPVKIQAGQTLIISSADKRSQKGGGGKTCYLAVAGGFDVPKYLGSASTFATGNFGGLTGSFLSAGDFLPIGSIPLDSTFKSIHHTIQFRWPLNKRLHPTLIPSYDTTIFENGDDDKCWIIGALNGPHASTDFLFEESINALWTAHYEVHHATNRLGARLIGPVPKWTRPDGGSAGLHPSNLHDYTYAPGAVNLSGNTAIVLMLDGPSLGGFVCPITVASADLWKIAQASPGDKIRFHQVDFDAASHAMFSMQSAWDAVRRYDMVTLNNICESWCPWWIHNSINSKSVPAVLAELDPTKGDLAELKVIYRQSGDEHILVEYGDIELDLAYRFRVHLLMGAIQSKDFILELCPGVRSLLVKFDRKLIHVSSLVNTLISLENGVLGLVKDVSVPSRILKLPLAFNDKWTIEAQSRYLRSVRPDAPYMPSNVEFIRRINGLPDIDSVKNIMSSAEYMVLGLGDVYLGAPCAVPVDPRHRLVTSKYNPARTFTPEGAVGIGGAYMCIYGMDSPGGYQLTGRTLPIWDNYGTISEKQRGASKQIPWLLRLFDRVSFFIVSDDELEELRCRYRNGDYTIEMKDEIFSYKDYESFLKLENESIMKFEQMRENAYAEERSRWDVHGEAASDAAAKHASENNDTKTEMKQDDDDVDDDDDDDDDGDDDDDDDDGDDDDDDDDGDDDEMMKNDIGVYAGVSANIWSVGVTEGDVIEKGDDLFSLESMKVEISIKSPSRGTVYKVLVKKGESVQCDSKLAIINVPHDAACDDDDMLTINGMRELRKLGLSDEKRVLRACFQRASQYSDILHMMDMERCEEEVENVMGIRRKRQRGLPLYCVPFIISSNFIKECSGVMRVLKDAGGIVIGTFNGDDDQVEMRNIMKCCSFIVMIDGKDCEQLNYKLGSGMSMIRLTEGLLPIVHNSDDYKKSISMCVRGGLGCDDIDHIFNACMSSRCISPFASIVRQIPDTFSITLDEMVYRDSIVIKWYDVKTGMNNLNDKLESDGFQILIGDVDMSCMMIDGAGNKYKREVEANVWSQGIDLVAFTSSSCVATGLMRKIGWCCVSICVADDDGHDTMVTFVGNELNEKYLVEIMKSSIG